MAAQKATFVTNVHVFIDTSGGGLDGDRPGSNHELLTALAQPAACSTKTRSFAPCIMARLK